MRSKRVPHILFEHRPAGRLQIVELVENIDHLVHDERLFLRPVEIVIEHIDAHRPREIAGIEIDHVIQAFLRHETKRVLGELAVRIDDRKPFPRTNILHREVPDGASICRCRSAR